MATSTDETAYAEDGHIRITESGWQPQQITYVTEQEAGRKNPIVQNITYGELTKRGYAILAIPNKGQIADKSIRVIYALTPTGKNEYTHGNKPENVDIEYDRAN